MFRSGCGAKILIKIQLKKNKFKEEMNKEDLINFLNDIANSEVGKHNPQIRIYTAKCLLNSIKNNLICIENKKED